MHVREREKQICKKLIIDKLLVQLLKKYTDQIETGEVEYRNKSINKNYREIMLKCILKKRHGEMYANACFVETVDEENEKQSKSTL